MNKQTNDIQRLQDARQLWDSEAATFDQEPDHGLRDPTTRTAWQGLLQASLPPPPAAVLDIGCGTGSLSVLLAKMGYRVTAIDLSPVMITLARQKAANVGVAIPFGLMDAYQPALAPGQFDVVLGRHLLWALPETAVALQRWVNLLVHGGRLVLIEGFWHTGGGLRAGEVVAALPEGCQPAEIQDLGEQQTLWGSAVHDERFLVMALVQS